MQRLRSRIFRTALASLILISLFSMLSPAPKAFAAGGDNPVKQVADTVKATVEAINAVNALLNNGRSVRVEVDNNTNFTFVYQSSHHAHGGFAALPNGIMPQGADVFGSQNKGGSFMTGTEGQVTYVSTDGSVSLTIGWDNPYLGSNECHVHLDGDDATNYGVFCIAGSGNNKAEMRYVLFSWAIFTPRFSQAAQYITDGGGDPGTAINQPHEWNGIVIQDYRGSQWGDGAVVWDKSTANPQYIGGGEWVAFKESLYTYNTWPGYPVNGAHLWNGLHIQDTRGGLHGDGAFIGGANAKYVTWRIWPAYVRIDGSRRLRNPLTYAVPRQDGHGNWYDVQQFEGGEIWARKQGTSVYFYDTNQWQHLGN